VVVSHQPFNHGLLFHELVHVEQYRQLGIQQFANLYVRGFLRGVTVMGTLKGKIVPPIKGFVLSKN
jgi:hypothetical protein